MKKLGLAAIFALGILSGCGGGSTEQSRVAVSDYNVLEGSRTSSPQTNNSSPNRSPTSQTANNSDESTQSDSSDNVGDNPQYNR